VDEGDAVTLGDVLELIPVAGNQLKLLAPDADNVVELPVQIVSEVGVTETVKLFTTLTKTVAVSVHVPLTPITVYVIVLVGVEVTFAELVLLRSIGGNQE
jgi:hypothetical protein